MELKFNISITTKSAPGTPAKRDISIYTFLEARPGFINTEYLVGQVELFLHEWQTAGGGEPLGRLGRLAVTHLDHPEMFGVPVHPQLELLDTGLRFGVWERSCFRGMSELASHILELSPVATSNSTHVFFLR